MVVGIVGQVCVSQPQLASQLEALIAHGSYCCRRARAPPSTARIARVMGSPAAAVSSLAAGMVSFQMLGVVSAVISVGLVARSALHT